MLILKGIFFGMALFIIGCLAYMFLARKFSGSGIISTDSPYLWLAFVFSVALGYVIAARGLWIIEGLLLGGGMFIVGVAVYWIAYPRILNMPPPQPGASIGISIPHLLPWLFVALISSLGLALAIVALWPNKGIPVP
jgi:hypothetical protein